MNIEKVISGGQTGVDRAALDAALELGVPCGGWCPRGRRAEDGLIPERYPLRETETVAYPQRTAMNIEDADGTLILATGDLSGGTALTAGLSRKAGRPCHVVNLEKKADLAAVQVWVDGNDIRTLNVAGPRESLNNGIYTKARVFLEKLLTKNST
ncbi:MAG: molybdenum cofactor carrier [Gammaproteobacteria bacterium]|nr:molybdenum cofactor carrier [Gammaproteobacteria bacterium]